MSRAITYAFSLASPWAYLGHDIFHGMVARHALTVTYRPMLLGEVFAETGGLPLPKRHPARQAYRLVELQRWRSKRDLSLNLSPKGWPCDITLADRLVIAIVAAGRSPVDFMRAVHRGIWALDRQMDDEATLAQALIANGHSRDLLAQARSDSITRAYADNRDWAIANGVFGAPSYVLDGEIFWGQDRLEALEDALISGRAPFRADPKA
ncbi:MAG: 2-hydroxychromene-2-carboxylate isomerase [Rhizobiales bacterium]|nr:2-hydroxychromene-2-carboxylate isomerase [Hyphomicrobiales bacterium]